MISMWFEIFYAWNLMLMPLQSLIASELLFFVNLPQFDGHILCTACQVFSVGMEVYIIDHSSVVSQSLLTLTCFIVPNFDRCIFTCSGYLCICWMEYNFRDPSSVTYQFQLFGFPWYRISSTLCQCILIWCELAKLNFIVSWLNHTAILSKLCFHLLDIDLMLLVCLWELLDVLLQLHDLFL